VSAHAALAGRALDVDVLEHALDVADGGVDAGGDCVDLHGDGVQTTIQCRETLTCTILIVPKEKGCRVQVGFYNTLIGAKVILGKHMFYSN